MKKTLLTVLCLAVGISFANAQTHSAQSVSAKQQSNFVTMSQARPVQQTGYKGSIFTKDDPLFATTFAAADTLTKYNTGVIETATVISGDTAVAHGQTSFHATWHRIADTASDVWGTAFYNQCYPWFHQSNWFNDLSALFTEGTTPSDGFMLMTMLDQYQTGLPGLFDAYISFTAFATTGIDVVDVNFWQYYQCFNADKCYIDYSTNGTSWQAIEINVRGVDLQGNESTRGVLTTTLPASCSNTANLYLRLRWTSASNVGNIYGYYWVVDDFNVTGGPTARLTTKTQTYDEGFYQIMPKGLQVPMAATFVTTNTGANTQSNITAHIYTMNDGGQEGNYSTAVDQAHSNTVASAAFNPLHVDSMRIDPFGIWASNNWCYYGLPQATLNAYARGSEGHLPTDLNEGVHGFYYANVTTNDMTSPNVDGSTYDTINYVVNDNSGLTSAKIWGRDNGVLRKYSSFIWGLTSDALTTSNASNCGYNQADYMVRVGYTTGSEVPENWVIRGVQIVASTRPGYATAGTTLTPVLAIDSTNGESIWFNPIDHGAGVYTVTQNDIPALDGLTYRNLGAYNVINIQFPNQPELQPKSTYRVGYSLTAPSTFCVAHSTTYYFDENHMSETGVHDTSAVFFRDVNGMKAYNKIQTVFFNKVMIYDPNAGRQQGFGFTIGTQIPMIRLLVGPKVYIPKYAFTFECGDNGEIINNQYQNVCGNVDSVVQSATVTYYAQATTDGYEADKVYLDGQELTNGDGILNMQVDDETGAQYAQITISDVQAAHSLRATFKQTTTSAIDPVAENVSMRLSPNPATNNVQLSISGVTGMVNYSLIDMSGRVITSARINAENVNTINVSNLAKGAYFVRITNNQFSKVEKLIVR